jgi:hypothetical protein
MPARSQQTSSGIATSASLHITEKQPLPTPPYTGEPPYTDKGTTIYRSLQLEETISNLPTSSYSFRPPLGTTIGDEQPKLPSRPVAGVAGVTGPTMNQEISTCVEEANVTHTRIAVEPVPITGSPSVKVTPNVSHSLDTGLADVTPCGGPKTGPPSKQDLAATAKGTATEFTNDALRAREGGSAPGPAATSITHTRPLAAQTASSSWRCGNIMSLPSVQPCIPTPLPAPAPLSHLYLRHQETVYADRHESTSPDTTSLAGLLALSTLIPPLTYILSPPSRRNLSPHFFLTLSLTTTLLPLFTLTLARPAIPQAWPDPDNTASSSSSTTTINTSPPGTASPSSSDPHYSDCPLCNLPTEAAAAIWAVTGITFLLALVVLVYFAGVKVCWARWSARRKEEQRRRDYLWWAAL